MTVEQAWEPTPEPAAPHSWPPPPYATYALPAYPPAVQPAPHGRGDRFSRGLVIGLLAGIGIVVFGIVAVIVGGVLLFNASTAGSLGEDPRLDSLYEQCTEGDMGACDNLYTDSQFGSELEEFGATCGGRLPAWTADYCTDLEL